MSKMFESDLFEAHHHCIMALRQQLVRKNVNGDLLSIELETSFDEATQAWSRCLIKEERGISALTIILAM